MDRREFFRTAGAGGALAILPGSVEATARAAGPPDQRAAGAQGDRDVWTAVLRRLADPVLHEPGQRHAEDADAGRAGGRRQPAEVTHLEALGRLVAGIAPWIELAADATAEGAPGAVRGELTRRAIGRAVDPASPDFLNFTRERQPLVDAAFLAHGLLRAPRTLATPSTRPRRATSSRRSNRRGPSRRATTTGCCSPRPSKPGSCALGAPWDRLRVDYAVRQHDQWYKGDGAYGDGPAFHWDYYNSFVIHPMLLDVLDTFRDETPAWKTWPRASSRARGGTPRCRSA